MKLEFGFLAEAAMNKNGQLYVLGTFDVVGGAQFPLRLPQFALVLKLAAHPTELGNHDVKIRLVDSDGNAVIQPGASEPFGLNGQITFAPNKMGKWLEATSDIVLTIGGMTFTKADTYCFSVLVDGRHVGDVRFFVVNEAAGQQAA